VAKELLKKSCPTRPQAGKMAKCTGCYAETFDQREHRWRVFSIAPLRKDREWSIDERMSNQFLEPLFRFLMRKRMLV
jgi:hypothetical protein